MALKEEFEYLSFRCCYCYFLNPARKKRPPAPKLEIGAKQQLSIEGPNTSESEKNSSTDTDSEQEATLSSPSRFSRNLQTLYPKEKEPSSDSERNDFDKLSDAEFKNSDNETTATEIDNVNNEEIHQECPTQPEEESSERKEKVEEET